MRYLASLALAGAVILGLLGVAVVASDNLAQRAGRTCQNQP